MPSSTVAAPASLLEQLQEALGAQYAIERELGGGGMSRVFLARERALGRQVVVKVLPPDLGHVDLDRFRREIHVAAQLQHPHIVPVHRAGEHRGTPYYVMPYIEGESLRALLARGGPLPIADVVRLLREVADALAYAHERGVVHRDVKPDNVLLSDRHAVVTDFGVAKALSASGPRSVRHATDSETGVGMAIGTPAYMAPEQAAGDPSTDHRADLYALGLVAWELLAGEHPFGKRPAHEMLAAHLAEQPDPIAARRAGVPADLAVLVARLLEKRPADRPQSAREVIAALESIVSSGSTLGLRRPRSFVERPLAVMAAALAALVITAGGLWLGTRGKPLDENVVAVLPFHLSTRTPELGYLREGMLDLLAATLTGEGGPRSADPRAILAAWRRAGGADSVELPRERALGVADHIGAGRLLVGRVSGTGERVVLEATLLRTRDGRAEAQVRAEGAADSVAVLAERLVAQLLVAKTTDRDRASSIGARSLAAVRPFLEGNWLYRRGRFRDAGDAYERALAADTTFALAALHLTHSAVWAGDGQRIVRGIQLAWLHVQSLSAYDRLQLEAFSGPKWPSPPGVQEVVALRRRLVQMAPDRVDSWFWLGDNLMHSGELAGIPDALAEARAALRRAIELDPDYAPALEHLALLEARFGDTTATRAAVRAYHAQTPVGENGDGIRWRLAVLTGDRGAHARLARRIDSLPVVAAHTIAQIAQHEGLDLDFAEEVTRSFARRAADTPDEFLAFIELHDLLMNRGKLAEARALRASTEAASPASSDYMDREAVRAALFWDEEDAYGAAAADRLRARVASNPHRTPSDSGIRAANACAVGVWAGAHGRFDDVRRMLGVLHPATANDAQPGGPVRRICGQTLEAFLAVREGRPDARARLARVDSSVRTASDNWNYTLALVSLVSARLHESLGDVPAARAALERRPFFHGRTNFFSTVARERARLAAKAGDRDTAVAEYRRYVAMRAPADPALRADLEHARGELARLSRESAGR